MRAARHLASVPRYRLSGQGRSGTALMARLWAGRELVYLGYGRPAQAITGPDGGPLKTATTFIIECHEP